MPDLPETWRMDIREALAIFTGVPALQEDLNIWREKLAEGESLGYMDYSSYFPLEQAAHRALGVIQGHAPPLGGASWPTALISRLEELADIQQGLLIE